MAFQRISEVEGAGPAENRENSELPMNWGHSNLSNAWFMVDDVVVMFWALTTISP